MWSAARPATGSDTSSTTRHRDRLLEPGDLVVLHRPSGASEHRRRPQGLGVGAAAELHRRRIGHVRSRVDLVDHDRPEPDTDPIDERRGRLDHLVDRCRLGQRDEHDLASFRVAQQLHHVLRLGVHGPATDGVEHPLRRREERDRVSGGRTVDHDQVPLPGSLELLDLAEHDDVVDAGRGGADDVDHAARCQPLGDPREAVLAEVLVERVAGGDRADLDARAGGRRAPACRRARRRARAGPRRLPRARGQPLRWSCRHPPCRPPPRRWRRSTSATDRPPDRYFESRSPEAPLRRLVIGLLAGASLLALPASGRRPSAQDAAQADATVGPVDVLQVSGLFDAIIVDEIGDAIERVRRAGRAGAGAAGQLARCRRR